MLFTLVTLCIVAHLQAVEVTNFDLNAYLTINPYISGIQWGTMTSSSSLTMKCGSPCSNHNMLVDLSQGHWLAAVHSHVAIEQNNQKKKKKKNSFEVSIVPVYNQASIFTTLVCNKWVNHLFCGNSKAQ